MTVFTLDQDTINVINSRIIHQNLGLGKKCLDAVKTVLDKTHKDRREKLTAIGRLGVCLSLVNEDECQISQLETFLQVSDNYSWTFNPKEFNSILTNETVSPIEYVIRFTHRRDVIDCVLSSNNDNGKVNDTFQTVYDNLDIERKKLFINHKVINVNHQHTEETPSLIINRLLFKENFSEIKMLIDSGADPHLIDTEINQTFIQLAGIRLNNTQFLDLITKLDNITSFHLLLHLYENISNPYTYEGLYFTFYHFYKNENDISFRDILRYISIFIKFNLGDKDNENKYLDTYIYLIYLIFKAENMDKDDTDIQSLQNLRSIIEKHYSKDIVNDVQTILDIQKEKKSPSKYRILPDFSFARQEAASS